MKKILVLIFTIVLIIIVVFTVLGLFIDENNYTEPVIESDGMYKSQKYGFEITYPDGMYSIEVNPEGVVLDDTLEFNNGADAEVFIYVTEIPEQVSFGDIGSTAEYLASQANVEEGSIREVNFADNKFFTFSFSPPEKNSVAQSYVIQISEDSTLTIVAKDESINSSTWFQELLTNLVTE